MSPCSQEPVSLKLTVYVNYTTQTKTYCLQPVLNLKTAISEWEFFAEAGLVSILEIY